MLQYFVINVHQNVAIIQFDAVSKFKEKSYSYMLSFKYSFVDSSGFLVCLTKKIIEYSIQELL